MISKIKRFGYEEDEDKAIEYFIEHGRFKKEGEI
jgi:hypothetical protein